MNMSALHGAIAKVCPIAGVSVGDPADKSTWRIDFGPAATDLERAAAASVMAAYVAAPTVPPISYLQFEALFTPGESNAIMATASGGNAAMLRWLLRAAGATQIDLGNPEVADGVGALVAAGLVPPERAAQILAGSPPPA